MSSKVIFSNSAQALMHSENTIQPSRVMVESPLGGDLQRNLVYARLCMRHSLLICGESPMAFHLVYPQSLCDDTDIERSIGIGRSFEWHTAAQAKLFYIDRGFSNGMRLGYMDAIKKGIETEFRSLSKEPQISALVSKLNERAQNDSDLEAASTVLKGLSKLVTDVLAQPGDLTDFRQHYSSELEKIGNIAKNIDHAAFEFERLSMRHSLLMHGEAPLSLALLYNQFIDDNDGFDTALAGDVWRQAADTVINYTSVSQLRADGVEDREVDFRDVPLELEMIRELNDPNYSSRERKLEAELCSV
jgi:hypothetical protein